MEVANMPPVKITKRPLLFSGDESRENWRAQPARHKGKVRFGSLEIDDQSARSMYTPVQIKMQYLKNTGSSSSRINILQNKADQPRRYPPFQTKQTTNRNNRPGEQTRLPMQKGQERKRQRWCAVLRRLTHPF